MRKFIALAAVVALLLGIRLSYNGLLMLDMPGVLTVYHKGGEITVYDNESVPALLRWNEPCRLDIEGGKAEAEKVLTHLSAQELWTEEFEGVTVIYAYSGSIRGFEKVKGEKVNLMLAINSQGVSIGTPLLKGSY